MRQRQIIVFSEVPQINLKSALYWLWVASNRRSSSDSSFKNDKRDALVVLVVVLASFRRSGGGQAEVDGSLSVAGLLLGIRGNHGHVAAVASPPCVPVPFSGFLSSWKISNNGFQHKKPGNVMHY